MGFIDKALEKAKIARKKDAGPKSSPGLADAAFLPPPTEARLTEQLIIPQEIQYTITRTLPVDPECLRRNRVIAGGWEAGSAIIEDYKVLRTHILHRTSEEGRNTLMVTGPLPGEGKTLTASTTWKDLRADSLDLVQILVALEEAFNLEISDEDAEKLKSFGDLVAYVDGVLAQRSGAA